MNTSMKIALMHLIILGAQAFYMFLSNRKQMLRRRYLYLLAAMFVVAFPVIINKQNADAYALYEYAVVVCIIIVALVDSVEAAAKDKDYLTDERTLRLQYTYFFICLAVSFASGISSWVGAVTVLALIVSFSILHVTKKQSPIEIIKSLPLAAFSYACSYALLYSMK